MNVFQVAMNDQSIAYLGRIFGNVGSVLAGTGPQLLGTMFKVFNTTLLSVAVLVVVYTTVVGVLYTAVEGEPMGKKFSSLWVPLRALMGVVGLVPTKTGYCAVQMIMMWFIIQGIGAADSVWSATLDYFKKGGATQINAGRIGTDAGVNEGINKLFQGLSCQAIMKANYNDTYYCGTADRKDTDFCKRSDEDMLSVLGPQAVNSPSVAIDTYYFGPGDAAGGAGACGFVSLDRKTSQSAGVYDKTEVGAAQYQALQAIIPELGLIAKRFVDIDYLFRQAQTTIPDWLAKYCSDKHISATDCAQLSQTSSTDVVKNIYWPYALYPYVGGNFLKTNRDLYVGYVGNAATKSSLNEAAILDEAKAQGWIFAGAYYYSFASATNNYQGNVNSLKDDVKLPDNVTQNSIVTSLPDSVRGSVISGLQKIPTQTSALIDEISSEESKGKGFVQGDVCQSAWIFKGLCGDIVNGWFSALSGDNAKNPIVAMQAFGQLLLMVAQIAFTMFLTATMLSTTFAQTMSSVQGAGWGTMMMWTIVIGPFYLFIMLFFTMGGMLAVYMPLIPYMLFIFGAIGWFIATIETMVAAPIVALGVLHPDAQHDIWGKAEPAIMLILNVFLRPTLMIFGMIAAMLVSYVVLNLINATFMGTISKIGSRPGLVEIILFMMVGTALDIIAMNKCFALIHLIPDKVLRWISGGEAQFGEGGGIEEMRGKAEAGIGGIQGAGGGALSRTAGARQKKDGGSPGGDGASVGLKKS